MAVLEQMNLLPQMQNIKLQNFIVAAMYAAILESELGSEAAAQIIGADDGGKALEGFMEQVLAYHSASKIKVNGVKIPHLLPGGHLSLNTAGHADNGYADLEGTVLRWGAAGLNVPLGPFAKDY